MQLLDEETRARRPGRDLVLERLLEVLLIEALRCGRVASSAPMEHLLAWRMALAQRLLCAHDLGIDQIAERVGYSSASTFTTAFARHVGMPPARDSRMRPNGRGALP